MEYLCYSIRDTALDYRVWTGDNSMREKMRSFMSGRYGTDQLGRFTMGVGAVCLLLYMFFRFNILYFITLICLIGYYFRAFSRNHARRYEENLKFLQLKNRLTGRFRGPTAHIWRSGKSTVSTPARSAARRSGCRRATERSPSPVPNAVPNSSERAEPCSDT